MAEEALLTNPSSVELPPQDINPDVMQSFWPQALALLSSSPFLQSVLKSINPFIEGHKLVCVLPNELNRRAFLEFRDTLQDTLRADSNNPTAIVEARVDESIQAELAQQMPMTEEQKKTYLEEHYPAFRLLINKFNATISY
jgi:hypothetical protein